MRKGFLVSGIIIVLIGIMLVSSYNEAELIVYSKKAVLQKEDTWKITCNLTEGDIVKWDWYESPFWADETKYVFEINDDELAAIYALVDLKPINPQGNATIFWVERVLGTSINPEYVGRPFLNWNITLYKGGAINASAILDEDGRYTGVGGRIPFDGTYEASLQITPYRQEPPSLFGAYHNESKMTYPNTVFLPAGITVITLGGMFSFYGVAASAFHKKRRNRAKVYGSNASKEIEK